MVMAAGAWDYLVEHHGEGAEVVQEEAMAPYMFVGVEKALQDHKALMLDPADGEEDKRMSMDAETWFLILRRYKALKGPEACEIYLEWLHGTILRKKGMDWEIPKSIIHLLPGLLSLYAMLEKLSGTEGSVFKEALEAAGEGHRALEAIFDEMDAGVHQDGKAL